MAVLVVAVLTGNLGKPSQVKSNQQERENKMETYLFCMLCSHITM